MTFFIISGFVVTNSFQYYRKTTGDVLSVPLFLTARMVRVWSLTIPTALVSFLLAYHYRIWSNNYHPWRRFTHPELLWKSALGYHSEWLGPGWTLIYELWAYEMIPFILLLLLARSWVIKLIAAGFLTAIAYFHITVLQIGSNIFIPLLSCFAIGVSIYFIRFMRFSPQIGAIIAIFGFAGMIILGQIHEVAFDNLFWKLIACTAVFTGFFALNPGNGRIATALIFLGACSYSLYLWHWPIFYFGNFYGNGSNWAVTVKQVIIMLTVQVPLTLVVTWLSYRYIERYIRMSWFIGAFSRLRVFLTTLLGRQEYSR